MEIIYEMIGDTLTAQLMGELDHHTAVKVRSEIDNMMDRYGAKNLIFDFSKVTFMDSAGIGVVLGRYKRLQAGGEVGAESNGTQAGDRSASGAGTAGTKTGTAGARAAATAAANAAGASADRTAASGQKDEVGSVVIAGCSQKIYSILHMAGIFSLMKYTETKEEAVAYLHGKEVC